MVDGPHVIVDGYDGNADLVKYFCRFPGTGAFMEDQGAARETPRSTMNREISLLRITAPL
ncbi:MAG TPA: hypothetical protein ENN34_02315 [Deltaproteobacteria bacterium]|nr:hypothetical protein [Deltaproteobacteria bacterium]